MQKYIAFLAYFLICVHSSIIYGSEYGICDAAKNGMLERVKELIQAEVDPNICEYEWASTPVGHASTTEILNLLLDNGADASKIINGLHPIHENIKNCDINDCLNNFQILVKASADPYAISKEGLNTLYVTLKKSGSYRITNLIKALVEDFNFDPIKYHPIKDNHLNSLGFFLHSQRSYPAGTKQNSFLELLSYLKSKGVNFDNVEKNNYESALTLAVNKELLGIVKALTNLNVDLEIKNNDKYTALLLALRNQPLRGFKNYRLRVLYACS